jgi:aspartate/methionine/tyrosine aminotransferase
VQGAAAQLLADGRGIREQIARRIAEHYRWLRDQMSGSSSCRVLRAEGGWSAVLHVPSLGSEEDLVVDLLTSRGVLVHPGYFFDFPRESYLVVSLLTPPALFVDGVGRILQYFGDSAPVRV